MKMIHMFFLVLHSFGRLTMYKSTALFHKQPLTLTLPLFSFWFNSFCTKRKKTATLDEPIPTTFQLLSDQPKNNVESSIDLHTLGPDAENRISLLALCPRLKIFTLLTDPIYCVGARSDESWTTPSLMLSLVWGGFSPWTFCIVFRTSEKFTLTLRQGIKLQYQNPIESHGLVNCESR